MKKSEKKKLAKENSKDSNLGKKSKQKMRKR